MPSDVAIPVDPFTSPDGARFLVALSAFMQTLLDDPDAKTARATLGIADPLTLVTLKDAATLLLKTLVDPVLNGNITGSGLSAAAAASVLAARDANANLFADNFVAGADSTVTAAGTTTLTVDSKQNQLFTGATTQTVTLPTTGVTTGMSFLLVNQSTGNVTVNASAGGNVTTAAGGVGTLFVALAPTPTLAAQWFFFRMYPISASVASSTAVLRDGNGGNILGNNFLGNSTSVVTAAGTSSPSVSGARNWVFTGSTTQTVTLPTTSIVIGHTFVFTNLSSGTVTINSSGSNLVTTLTTGQSATVMANVATPTTAAQWTIVGKNF